HLRTGVLNPEPFVTVTVSTGGETGLLGMAFDPAYAANGYIYLHHSNVSPPGTRIVRYAAMPGNPDRADPTSETEVFFDAHALGFHQGGWTEFGPDGLLYFSIGNLQVNPNSQSLVNLYGKVLRID